MYCYDAQMKGLKTFSFLHVCIRVATEANYRDLFKNSIF